MQMNQVAIAYTSDEEKAIIKAWLGLTNEDWVKDRVVSAVKVLGRDGNYVTGYNVAELEFCMAMGGTQFELIRYVEGPNWINVASRLGVGFPMVAHVGFHLEDGEPWPPIMEGGVLAQEAYTTEHSNEEVNKIGRRYHYRIYRVGPAAYFKFIKRCTVVEQEPGTTEEAATQAEQLPPAADNVHDQQEQQAGGGQPETAETDQSGQSTAESHETGQSQPETAGQAAQEGDTGLAGADAVAGAEEGTTDDSKPTSSRRKRR